MKKILLLALSALSYINVFCGQKESIDFDPVGAVQGALNISPTGAAIYSIPIDIPQGVGGMQPSVGITYNSQSGNGMIGWGCNLSGFSVITRAPKTVYYDKIANGLTYGVDDVFYLDGQRLIHSGGTLSGTSGAVYQFESTPLSKVEISGIGSSMQFCMQTSNGMKYYYGKTSSGRHSYSENGETRINAWYLDYVEDAMGNYMDYIYSNKNNVIYIEKITYGMNKLEVTNLTNTITFSYETRNDQTPVVFDKIKRGDIIHRLLSIACSTNDALYRKYELAYDNAIDKSETKYSRLTKVTVKNSAGEALKPLTLKWVGLPASTQAVKSLNFSSAPSGTTHANQTFISGDFNGDGLTDIMGLYAPNNSIDQYACIYSASKNTSYINFYSGTPIRLGQNIVYNKNGNGAYNRGVIAVDINHDGADDLVIPHFDNADKSLSFRVLLSPLANANEHIISASSNPKNTFAEVPLFSVNDLDNDGCVDIIYLEKGVTNGVCNARIITISRDGEKSKDIPFKLNIPSKPEKMFVSDFNCDGLQDILVFYDGGYIVYWNQGSGLNATTFSNNKRTSGTNIGNVWMIRSGDFNGDGMMDFIMNATNDKNWYFALNKGNGAFEKKLAYNIDIYDQDITKNDDNRFDCQVYDFDFDGKSDIIITKAMYMTLGLFTKTYTYWMRSTGSALTQIAAASSKNADDALSWRYITGDFNGDGQPDLINYGYDCYSTTSLNLGWRMYVNSAYQPECGKVCSVTDGYGNLTNISYASLTDASVYTKGSYKPTYPMKTLTLPIHGVSKIATSNGKGGFINTAYTYQGLIVHLTGKGFLGMSSQTVKNTTLGITRESGVKSWNEKFGVPIKTYTKETLAEMGYNEITEETETSLKIMERGVDQPVYLKYFTHPDTITKVDLQKNKSTTTYKYKVEPNYENWHLTEEKVDFGNNMYITTTYSDFIEVGSAVKEYKPKLIIRKQKHSDDTSIFTQKTEITYNNEKGYQTKVVKYGGSSMLSTTDYEYDNIGNIRKTIASGSSRTTITTNFDYDSSKRFLAKSTTSPVTTTETFTYDIWGNLLTAVDETYGTDNHLTTNYEYDSWQNRTKTTYPDGRITTTQQMWNNNYLERYTLTETTGEPWVKKYYDRLGRVIMTESVGPKGMKIEEKTMFGDNGFPYSKTTKTGNITTSEDYRYDALGRIKYIKYNETTFPPDVEYFYGNGTISKTTNGKKRIEEYDAWGNLRSVKDPVSTILYTYHSSGNPKQIKNGDDTPVTMTYYDTGKQETLTDPNVGTITYTYDGAGRIIKQTDSKGKVTTSEYDSLDRLVSSTVDGVKTSYTYGTSKPNYDYLRLTNVKTGNNDITYTYDKYGRTKIEKRQIGNDGSLTFTYNYNNQGQMSSIVYPGNLTVSQQYDKYGNIEKVQAGTQAIWELKGATGQVATTQLGGTLMATQTRDAQGLLTNLKTEKGTTVLHNMNFVFDKKTGNLLSRRGMTNEIEMFHYDDVERLTTVMRGDSAKTVMKMNYASNGNISSKTGLGLYGYETPKPHAVTSIKNSKGLLSENPQSITYTAFNKLSTIEEKVDSDTYNLSVAYGPDQQRWKTTLKKNGNIAKTTIFADDYEAITENGVTKQLYYIGGGDGLAAIYVKQTGQADKIYYPHQDHLGSIMKLTDGNGTEVFKASYDAWGNQTISNNTFAFYRGYTGHEHLKEFKLINMNGRMYDPIVGRFLSPDPYVQMPDFSQNFNRYSYCLNNPLRFTDPSGEIIHIIAGALIGGVINLTYKIATGQVTNFESGFLAFGIGAAAGALAAVVGPAAFAAAGGSGAVIGSGGFMAGFVAGGSAYLTHTGVQSTGNHLAFGDKFPTAGEIAQNFSFAALSGGVLNGLTAVNQGRNFWNGDIPRPGASLWSMNSTSIYSGTSKMEMINLQNISIDPERLKMNEVRRLGIEGENAVGIEGVKIRIPSHTKTANYRIPDQVTDKAIIEVKNVKNIGITNQLRDMHIESQLTDKQMILYTRPNTVVSRPLIDMIGKENIKHIPPKQPIK